MSIHHKLSSNCRDSHVVAAAAAQFDASYFPGGANVQQCNIYIVPWAHASLPPNGISIGSSVLQGSRSDQRTDHDRDVNEASWA